MTENLLIKILLSEISKFLSRKYPTKFEFHANIWREIAQNSNFGGDFQEKKYGSQRVTSLLRLTLNNGGTLQIFES